MTDKFVAQDLNQQVTMRSEDTLLLLDSGTIRFSGASEGAIESRATASDTFMTLMGTVFNPIGHGILYDNSIGSGHEIHVTRSGNIFAGMIGIQIGDVAFNTYVDNAGTVHGQTGMLIDVANARLVNSGEIIGTTGAAISLGAGGGRIINSGTIRSHDNFGIEEFGTNFLEVNNTGSISGIRSTSDLTLDNAGTIDGFIYAILAEDGDVRINNAGAIFGEIDATSSTSFTYKGTTATAHDEISGSSAGRNFIHAGDNADDITGGDARDIIVGGGGNDILSGGEEFDRISGGLGDDEIFGGDGADILSGQEGDDTISGDAGDDRIYGGAGDDTLVDAVGGNDIMRGGTGDDILNSFAGDDDLRAGSGNDVLIAGVGQDDLFGEDGDDDLDGGFGMDTLRGGAGNDILRFDAFDTLINGGAGEDTIIKTDDVRQDINFNGLQFKNVEHLEAEDVVLGEVNADDQSNVINIGAARILNTYGGADDVRAVLSTFTETNVSVQQGNLGGGDDTFYANGTVHSLNLGDGNDRAEVAGRATIYGGAGDDRIEMFGSNTVDQDFHGNEGNDFLSSLSGDDVLRGGAGFDRLRADAGNDYLDGGADDDQLYGEPGNDTLFGGTGNDLLNGGEGDDRLTGGAGRDTFVFTDTSEFDRVLDFEDGLDRINLRAFGFTDAADALDSFVQQGSNVRIIEGSAVMVISNMQLADFSADDLLL